MMWSLLCVWVGIIKGGLCDFEQCDWFAPLVSCPHFCQCKTKNITHSLHLELELISFSLFPTFIIEISLILYTLHVTIPPTSVDILTSNLTAHQVTTSSLLPSPSLVSPNYKTNLMVDRLCKQDINHVVRKTAATTTAAIASITLRHTLTNHAAFAPQSPPSQQIEPLVLSTASNNGLFGSWGS